MIRYRIPVPVKSQDQWRTSMWYVLDILLFLIIIGPILSPLFATSGLRIFQLVADSIIYPLGLWICPQTHYLLPLGDHPMAVCSRCYAAIAGLLLVRLSLVSDPGDSGIGSWMARRWQRTAPVSRIALVVGTIGLWQFDLWAERIGWLAWDHPQLILSGFFLGLAIGFSLYPLLLFVTGSRASWSRS